jgi:CRP-like cAMP-binding protein
MNISLNSFSNSESFEKNDVIFKEGDLPDKFYLVESGLVRCLKWSDKRLIPVLTVGEGELIGEDCVLSDSNKYFYSAVALENCKLIAIDKSDVFAYLNSQSPWVKSILDNMSGKIQHTTDLIAEHKLSGESLLKNRDFSEEEEVLLRSKL